MSTPDWITPNEEEIRQLLEGTDQDLEETAAVEQLKAKGAKGLVVKLGPRGVLLKEKGQPFTMVPGFSVSAVDTTAAGDAFNGAFAVALVSGKSARQSAEFANAVAAISVMRSGAQSSMPDRAEVETFLRGQAAKTP